MVEAKEIRQISLADLLSNLTDSFVSLRPTGCTSLVFVGYFNRDLCILFIHFVVLVQEKFQGSLIILCFKMRYCWWVSPKRNATLLNHSCFCEGSILVLPGTEWFVYAFFMWWLLVLVLYISSCVILCCVASSGTSVECATVYLWEVFCILFLCTIMLIVHN